MSNIVQSTERCRSTIFFSIQFFSLKKQKTTKYYDNTYSRRYPVPLYMYLKYCWFAQMIDEGPRILMAVPVLLIVVLIVVPGT